MTTVTRTAYAMDLGNGFTKRMYSNGTVVIEPSVYAKLGRGYNNASYRKHSLDKKNWYYIGEDVMTTRMEAHYIQNEKSDKRYAQEEYKIALLGFIAKDFPDASEIVISTLVLGLPNTHFYSKGEDLIKVFKGKKVINVNDDEVTIKIEEVVVLPQPVGTYIYAVNLGLIQDTDQCLIVDIGSGTLDVSEVSAFVVGRENGAELGADKAYVDIRLRLIELYGETPQLTLGTTNIPEILEKGILIDGKRLPVTEDKIIQQILDEHFDQVWKFIVASKFNVSSYTHVVWTGGMAQLHEDRIKAKGYEHFIVIENGQIANVLGFYEAVGEGVDDGEEETSDIG